MKKTQCAVIQEHTEILYKRLLNTSLYKAIFYSCIFVYLWIYSEQYWIQLFNKHILPYLNLPNNFFCYLLMCSFMFGVILFLMHLFYKKYIISISSIFIQLILLYLYIRYRFILSDTYYYEPFIGKIAYIDILAILEISYLAIIFLNRYHIFYRHRIGNENEISTFILDKPIYSEKEDFLDYAIEARHLANKIRLLKLNQSYSIGITSPWGMGKTSFLNLLERALKETDDFDIIKFNPRNSKNICDIQKDFFSIMYSSLKSYNSNFSHLFKDYMKALELIDYHNIIPTILNIHQINDRKSEKEKIGNSLKYLPKKIAVFIDDFDRLLADEIIEVLKLIDGNASFPNLIFITAYDKKYISNILNEKGISEINIFSDKFFNVEICVPIRPYQKILDYLTDKIACNFPTKYESIKNVILKHKVIIHKYLPFVRDIKRFLNTFIHDYIPLVDEVDFEDYFLISIIKYKDPNLYRHLHEYKNEFLNTTGERYIIKKEVNNNRELYDVLSILFYSDILSSISQKDYRKINRYNSFDIYFFNYLYGQLSIKEMTAVLNINIYSAKFEINKWKNENKLEDFIEFLKMKNILAFDNKISFFDFLEKTFYASAFSESIYIDQTITDLLSAHYVQSIKEKYDITDTIYKNKIITFFKDQEYIYSTLIRKLILNLIRHRSDNDIIIFTEQELLNIAKENLINYAKLNHTMNQKHIDLLYSCITDINEQTEITLDKEACKIIKECIMKNPKYYISSFIRPYMISSDPNDVSITCEPYWKEIFVSSEEFDHFLHAPSLNDIDAIEQVRNFWMFYRNNDYKPFEFSDMGTYDKIIESNFKIPKAKFDNLVIIENEFYKAKKDSSCKTKQELIFICDDLLKRIDNNKLYIKKTAYIKEEIMQWKANMIK